MSGDDVYGFEMDEPHFIDDTLADDLVAGRGSEAEPALADLLADVRVAFTDRPVPMGTALAAFVDRVQPEAVPTRRSSRMRTVLAAKIAAAVTTAIAATGGLAAASALPAPMQHAVSSAASTVGIDVPASHFHGKAHPHPNKHAVRNPVVGFTATTTATGDTTETSEPTETTTVTSVAPSPTSEPEHHDNGLHLGWEKGVGNPHHTGDGQQVTPPTPAPTTEPGDDGDDADETDHGKGHTSVTTVPDKGDDQPGNGVSGNSHGDDHGGGGDSND